jgi:hypothetical protein
VLINDEHNNNYCKASLSITDPSSIQITLFAANHSMLLCKTAIWFQERVDLQGNANGNRNANTRAISVAATLGLQTTSISPSSPRGKGKLTPLPLLTQQMVCWLQDCPRAEERTQVRPRKAPVWQQYAVLLAGQDDWGVRRGLVGRPRGWGDVIWRDELGRLKGTKLERVGSLQSRQNLKVGCCPPPKQQEQLRHRRWWWQQW